MQAPSAEHPPARIRDRRRQSRPKANCGSQIPCQEIGVTSAPSPHVERATRSELAEPLCLPTPCSAAEPAVARLRTTDLRNYQQFALAEEAARAKQVREIDPF